MNNKKTTKRALLSSVMAIVLCLAMLIGTTFAWFTDSASTAVNKIQAGTLEIELQYATAWDERTGEPTDWANAEGQMLSFRKAAGASENEAILWEPGCTYVLPELRIVNKGNLALKYTMTISGIAGDAELNEAIEWEYAQYSTVNGAYEAALGGSLSSGDSISGAIIPGENNNATDPIVIKGHMKESAGNQYQGKSIDGIAITVVATQDTVEYDSFNNTYDANAEYALPVATSADLAAALASGNDVILTAPVRMPDVIEISGDVTIYGSENGKLLAPDHKDRVINIADNTEPVTLTLSNLDVVGPETGTYTRGVSVYGNTDVTVVVDNSSVSANYYALNIASANDSVDVVVKNTTLTGWCAFQTWSAGTKATFENCTLIGNNDKTYNAAGWNDFATIVINENVPNTELTFNNCHIEANQTTGNKQHLLSVRAHNAKVTLDGCTFFANGTEIADEDFSHYLEIYYADLVLTIDGEVIPIS